MPASDRLKLFHRHLGLWVLQGWLAMFFAAAAVAKLGQPQELLSYLLQWPVLVDPAVVRVVGAVELALAVGLLAPLASWRLFRSVLMASATLVLAETLAMGTFHAAMGHPALACVNLILAGMAVLVVLGRGRRTWAEARA